MAVPNRAMHDVDADVRAAMLVDQLGAEMPPERRLVTVELAEFLSREFPPRKRLLLPFLPQQGLVMIHAPRGIGKTHVSVGIAVAVASGSTFLRWSAPEPAGVLLIDGEMPAASLQERVILAIAASPVPPTAALSVITPDLNAEFGMPDLSSREGQDLVDAQVTPEIRLIIVDNLSSLARSGVENEGEGWLPLQTWALRHRAAGRSVLLIHHSGKNGLQRGTSRREDVLDSVLALKRATDYSPTQGCKFEVHYEKTRGFYGDDAAAFGASLDTDITGAQYWSTYDLEMGHEARIAELSALGMKANDIALEVGCSRATVYRRLKGGGQ